MMSPHETIFFFLNSRLNASVRKRTSNATALGQVIEEWGRSCYCHVNIITAQTYYTGAPQESELCHCVSVDTD